MQTENGMPVIEVAKSPSGEAPKTITTPQDAAGAIPSTYSQEGQVQSVDNTTTNPNIVSASTLPLEYQYDEKQQMANIATAISSDVEDVKEEDLKKDETFTYASKRLYKSVIGEDFTGSDEEATQYGIDLMRQVDNNLVKLTDFSAKVQNMSKEDAQVALYAMDMFEAKNYTAKGVGEALMYMGIDPTTYIGLGTLGFGFAGKQAAKQATKTAMRKVLEKAAFSPVGHGIIEGAGYTAAFEHNKQKVSEAAGKGYDAGAVGVAAGLGGAFGGTAVKVLPKAIELTADSLNKVYRKFVPKKTEGAGIVKGEPMNLEPLDPALVEKAANGDKEAFNAVAEGAFDRNFQRVINANTGDKLKPMLLQKLKDNPDMIEKLMKKYGFKSKYFTHNPDNIGNKVGDGAVEAPPANRQQLTKDGYQNDNIWVYDPTDTHGSFNDAEYTKAWRQVHELSHAITEHFMQDKYGDSRRFGALSFDIKNPYDPNDPRTYKGLTLAEAQRAIEWEDVAFRTQVKLLKELGIPVNEKEAIDDWNIAGTDTVVRALTGDFTDPAELGVVTDGMQSRIKTKDVLTILENQELLNAHYQGRKPTLGTDLLNWTPVDDNLLDANIKGFTKRQKPSTVNMSVESITGADTTGASFKEHLDNNPDLKAEYHKEIKPIVDNILKDNGLEVVAKEDSKGVWNGEVNPSTQYEIKIPKGGTTPEFQQKLAETAMQLAETLEQDGVGYNTVKGRITPDDGMPVKDANGVVLSEGEKLDTDTLTKVEDALQSRYPDGNLALVSTNDGLKIFDHTGNPVDGAKLFNDINDIMDSLNLDYKADQADITGNVALPDWERIKKNGYNTTNKTGTGSEASSGLSNSGRASSDYKSQVRAIQEKYRHKLSPKSKLAIPYRKGNVMDDKLKAAKSLTGKKQQQLLNTIDMRKLSPEDKQKVIDFRKSLSKPKKKNPSPKAQEVIQVGEEFNNQIYSKLEHEVSKIPDDKVFKNSKEAVDYLKKMGVKKDELDAAGLNGKSEVELTGETLKNLISERPDKIHKVTYDSDTVLDREDYEDTLDITEGANVNVGEAGYGVRVESPTGQYYEAGITYDDNVYVDDSGYEYDWSDMRSDWLDNYYDDEYDSEIDPDILMEAKRLEETGNLTSYKDNYAYREAVLDKADYDSPWYDYYGSKQYWVDEGGSYYDTEDEARDALIDQAYEDYEAYDADEGFFSDYTVDGGDNYRMEVYQMPDFTSSKDTHTEPHLDQMNVDAENVQAHARLKTREDADGNEGDVLEEVQSQWEQDWRGGKKDLASPPIKNRTQYEKIVLMDNILKSIKDGKDYFGWINGHIQNGGSIETTKGMSQAYDIEMPRIIQKATGETPYMAKFYNGMPVTDEKVYWDAKKAEDLEYYDNIAKEKNNGEKWYWRINLTDKLKNKLKDAKIQLYGVGGAALIGANSSQGESNAN